MNIFEFMVGTKDVWLSIIGFGIGIYGGYDQNFTILTLGIILVFVTITLRLSTQEEELNLLKMQINLYQDVSEIKKELERIRNEE